MDHEFYMRSALELARKASSEREVPVGCVVVDSSGEIIGRGYNRRERDKNALSHAELLAISEACGNTGGWRLDGCLIFVTLEPCPMCAGAIINSRIPTVVFGAGESTFGACGSVLNLFEENFGHRPAIYRGVLEKECREILSDFFSSLRPGG